MEGNVCWIVESRIVIGDRSVQVQTKLSLIFQDSTTFGEVYEGDKVTAIPLGTTFDVTWHPKEDGWKSFPCNFKLRAE